MNKILAVIPFLCCAIVGRAQNYILVGDATAHAIHIYNTTTASYAGDMAAPDPGFNPVSLAVAGLGQIYVADLRGNTAYIRHYGGIFYGYSNVLATLTSTASLSIAQNPNVPNQLVAVTATPDLTGVQFYTVNENNGSVVTLPPVTGYPIFSFLDNLPPSLFFGPAGSVPNGAVYVVLNGTLPHATIQAFNLATPTPTAVGSLKAPASSAFIGSAVFDPANDYLYLSSTPAGDAALPEIFYDTSPFLSSTPTWQQFSTPKIALTPLLGFDNAANLYAVNNIVQEVNPSTLATTTIGPPGIIQGPTSIAFVQNLLDVPIPLPIVGGGAFGFISVPPGGLLHLALTVAPSLFTSSSTACNLNLAFIDQNGNALASDTTAIGIGQAAALDYTNSTGALQAVRPVLVTPASAWLEGCGSGALPTLALNNNGWIVTVPLTSTGIPGFGPIGLPSGDTAVISLTNGAAGLPIPPDPCIVVVSILNTQGNILQQTTENIAPGATATVSYTSPPATLALTPTLLPVVQSSSSPGVCSALVATLGVVDPSGNPKAFYPGTALLSPITVSAPAP